MAKFGELVDSDVPVLIYFYEAGSEISKSVETILNDVADDIKDKAKIIKIDVDKNQKLVEALKIEEVPAFVLFKNAKMVWRQNGPQRKEVLVDILQKYSGRV